MIVRGMSWFVKTNEFGNIVVDGGSLAPTYSLRNMGVIFNESLLCGT